MRKLFKVKRYEVVSVKAEFIWDCDNESEAKRQLKYVKSELGYDDAYINIYEQTYSYF